MQKTILITGSTDGIGLAAARLLHAEGHHIVLHGRNPAKLEAAASELAAAPGGGRVESLVADLSDMAAVESLAGAVAGAGMALDVLINNAGVYRSRERTTGEGLDTRFAVNTIAPFLLTRRLLPLISESGRVVNLSSAAQSRVDLGALAGSVALAENEAYAQSKLALTMWSRHLAMAQDGGHPVIVAVNPGSLLGSKMVQEAYGIAGGDIGIGARILVRAAHSEDFASASGQYFDNDAGAFAAPHPDALDPEKCAAVVGTIEAVLAGLSRGE